MVKTQYGANADKWGRYVENLSESSAELRQSLEKFMTSQYEIQRAAEEREQLFARRNRGGGDNMDDLRYAQRESDSLDASLREADEILDTGAGVLGNLSDQRQMLKNMRKKMLGDSPPLPPIFLLPAAAPCCCQIIRFSPTCAQWQT